MTLKGFAPNTNLAPPTNRWLVSSNDDGGIRTRTAQTITTSSLGFAPVLLGHRPPMHWWTSFLVTVGVEPTKAKADGV